MNSVHVSDERRKWSGVGGWNLQLVFIICLSNPFMRNSGGQSYINFKEALAFFCLAFKRLCAAL